MSISTPSAGKVCVNEYSISPIVFAPTKLSAFINHLNLTALPVKYAVSHDVRELFIVNSSDAGATQSGDSVQSRDMKFHSSKIYGVIQNSAVCLKLLSD